MTGYVFIKADHLGPDCVTTYNDVEVWSAVKPPAWTENMASAQAREMPSAVAALFDADRNDQEVRLGRKQPLHCVFVAGNAVVDTSRRVS